MNSDIMFFETILAFLGMDLFAQETSMFLISAGAALAVSLIIRVLAGLLYYSHYSALMLFAKPIEKKSDIKRSPSSLINRCVAEYMACGESGAPLSGVQIIVMKNIMKMSFFGINLKPLEKMCVWLEAAALVTAALASVVTGDAGWLILIGATYLVYKIILLFFDAETLREKLFYGISAYLNRELGKLYIPDDKAGMRVFKNEIHSALTEQALILQNAVNNMTTELSGAIREANEAAKKTIGSEKTKYDEIGEKLKAPLEGLGAVAEKLDGAASRIVKSCETLSGSVSQMDESIKAVAGAVEKNNETGRRSAESAEAIFHELRDSLKSFNAAYAGLEAELSSVRDTQRALDASLESYELSLQQTAGKVGDAVGSILEYRGKEAAEALNEAVAAHIKQFQADTAKLFEKMTALFEQSYEQNKSEMQTLLRIEEAFKK